MESSSPEFERGRPEVVTVNQSFQLFPPNGTYKDQPGVSNITNFGLVDISTIFSRHTLRLEDIPDLPLQFEARPFGPMDRTHVMTPYHPQNGYVIDERDSDPEKRRQKVESMSGEEIDSQLDPLWFGITAPVQQKLRELGIQQGKELTPQFQDILQRLRVQLQFRFHDQDHDYVQTFESSPATPFKDIITFGGFGRFFPLETGPLPNVDAFPSDFNLRLPDDLVALQNIYGMFVLLPERENTEIVE